MTPNGIRKFDFQYNGDIIMEQGFVTNGRCMPYHPVAKIRGRNLRHRVTKAESKLRHGYLRWLKITVNRQKPIGHFIADFYCASHNIVIEVDGGIHNNPKNQSYDRRRESILQSYGLQIIRFTNDDVLFHFESVCNKLNTLFNI